MIDTYYRHATKKSESQDYVISNDNNIVLCDGCSSSPLTEIGSRVLAHIALEELSKVDQLIYSPYLIIKKAERVIKELSLPETCLDCTLVTLRVRGDKKLVNFFGDGTLVHEKYNIVHRYKMEYSENAPYYISYYLNEERDKAWREMNQVYTVNGEPLQGQCCHWEILSDKVAIFSDGIDSFELDKQPVDVLEYVLDIKTTKGKFLKRRCNHITMSHWDDFSAGMYINDTQ